MTNRERALAIIDTVYQAIKESGEDGIPSGHLYAAVMEVISLHTYQGIIELLTLTGKIKHSGYILKSL